MNDETKIVIRDVTGREFSFNRGDVHSFLSFCKREGAYWKKAADEIMVARQTPHHYVETGHSIMHGLIHMSSQRELITPHDHKTLSQKWLSSEQPYAQLFININSKFGERYADGFIDGVMGNSTKSTSGANYRAGFLWGHEYSNIDPPGIIQRGWENYKAEKDKEFAEFTEQQKQKMKKLESVYSEKLKLEAPSNYWKETASKHQTKGWCWGAGLAVVIIIGIMAYGKLFIDWFGADDKNTVWGWNSLQGIILFSTVTGAFAYLVRILSKLTFSYFHLARDAEERGKLTYFYLSLIEKAAVPDESKNIILQSLFSRADSGLLSSDSTPTMPAAINLPNIKNDK